MKKIFIISLILVAAAGCKKDPLNITPDGRITLDDVFSDNVQTGAYINSCYTYIQPGGMDHYFYTFMAAFTDESHHADDPTQDLSPRDWVNGGLTPTHDPLSDGGYIDYMNQDYQQWHGIYKTNQFLSRIDNANVTLASDKAKWKAEAKVLRAYYYWDLIRMYGGMPIVREPFTLETDYTKLTRNTFDSCVQFIVQDCEDAIAEPALPWRITTGEGDRGRMTKAIAYTIESEATLFNASPLQNPIGGAEKWQQAAAASKKAYDDLNANGYALFPDYGTFFITTPDIAQSPSDKETIYERHNAVGFGHTGDPSDNMQTHNGVFHTFQAGCNPTQELVDAFEMANGEPAITGYTDEDHLHPIINAASGYDENNPYTNRDPRFYSTVIYNGYYYPGLGRNVETFTGGLDAARNDSKYTYNGYYMKKFLDPTLDVTQGSGAQWRVFRLGEVYLNLAEAENEAVGPDAIAYAAVNAIRTRAGIPALTPGLSQADFRIRVRNERRIELSFEDKRFWDVRRWQILDKTDKNTSGITWTKTGTTLTPSRFVVDRRQAWSDKFLLFPIPLNEISTLSAFTQNPGW